MGDKVEMHTERYPGYELVFWKEGVAATRSDADVVVVQASGGFPYVTLVWPRQESMVSVLQDLLRVAHKRGEEDRAHAIRKALGIRGEF